MGTTKTLLLLAMLIVTAWALPQETEYEVDYGDDEIAPEEDDEIAPEEEEYDGVDTPPKFEVESQHLQAKKGETVVISCPRSNTQHVLIFKKAATETEKEMLLFVDRVKVRRDRRFKLNEDQLEISNLRRADAGTYICRVESQPAVELTHYLDVEFEPKITSFTGGEHRVHEGDSVKLECAAEGNPPPTIKWSKEGGRMPDGALEEEGLSITLAEVDRHVEGSYVCTAENGIGEPASKMMSLVVEYRPEIITEKDMVRTSDGDIIQLVCIVHARPSAKVEWTKDGSKLVQDDHIEEQQNGHRNTIKISHISEEDFGEYACTATNEFGVAEANFSLTGNPKPPHFTSSPNGGEESSYTLTWNTESYYPITEYELKYRKARANDSTDEPGEWMDMKFEINGNLETNGLVHSMKHTLDDLEAATDYNAVVKIKNQYSWSEIAEFSFSTKKEVAPKLVNGASLATISSTLVVLVPAFFLRTLSHC